MWPTVTDGSSMVCLSVRQSVCQDQIASPAKTAEPVKMPFGLWTRVGPRNQVLDGFQIPTRGEILRGKSGQPKTCPDMSQGRYTQRDSALAGVRTGMVRMLIGVYR